MNIKSSFLKFMFIRVHSWFTLLFLLSALEASAFEFREGGIIRGPKEQKKIALEFTGDSFAEGGAVILDELSKHKARASFFFTGKFLRNPEFKPLIERIIKDGHYIGPHSDEHLLYCPWEGEKKTIVTKKEFRDDLEKNLKAIEAFGLQRSQIKYWVPPYEWYNEEIVAWSNELGMTLINFTPGTRSTADYTEDDAKNFVSSQAIFESILKKEREDPHGLNGFLLLLHIGAGPKRTDKFHDRFGELLQVLSGKGYQFVRVDELLALQRDDPRRWEKEMLAFERADRTNPPPQNAVLFIGSSSIRGWKSLASDFPGHKVINRGFGGSHLNDSVYYFDRIVAPCKPRMIVVFAGSNDIHFGKTPEEVFAAFKAFAAKARAALPETRVAFISISTSPSRWEQVEKVKAANRLIENFTSSDPMLTFIDVFPLMLGEDGKPNPAIYIKDNLHMNEQGYAIWAEAVRPHLE